MVVDMTDAVVGGRVVVIGTVAGVSLVVGVVVFKVVVAEDEGILVVIVAWPVVVKGEVDVVE